MKGKIKGTFRPRPIDRVMFAILAAVCICSGGYVVGPWYLETNIDGGRAPLYCLFNSDTSINIYGYILVVAGIALAYASARNHATKLYTEILSWSLLIGFLLRLFSLIGVFLTLESWRPPGYLSHLATVIMLGSYWVWVKVYVRTLQ